MHFAIVNESTVPELDAALLGRIANALEKQMATDFSGHWENVPQVFTVCDAAAVPDRSSVFHLVDEIPEAPDALAYHTIDDKGRPVLRLGVKTILFNQGTLISGPDSVSAAMSHEACETWVNPDVATWSEFDAKKKLAYEVCDPVQGSSYEIDGVAVSNFVTPRYFDIEDIDGPYDYLGILKTPLTVAPNGYQAFDDGTQVFGDAMPEEKREQKQKYGRFARKA